MDASELEGWTTSEYKSFKIIGGDISDSSSDSDDSDDEQLFAKSSIVRKTKYKKLVSKETLLPE
jgi:hypothetical protein